MMSLPKCIYSGHVQRGTRYFKRALSAASDPDSTSSESNVPPPTQAKVVICGGGIMGASVAYHLAKMGWGPQTVLIEQSRMGGGTTWHSSGLMGVFKPSISQVTLTKASVALYKELQSKGLPTGWKQCGSLNIARTRDRLVTFRRMKAQSVAWKIDCEVLTPDQCQAKCPLLNVDDLYGGLWIPGDGVADPYDTCMSLITEAKNMGVTLVENCRLTKVKQTNGTVSSVETELGPVDCEYFVNCAGFWARGIGQLSEPYVKVPLHAVEHYYLHTKPIPGLDPMTPVVRDQDGHVYFRENNGKLLAGGFEPIAKPAYEDGKIPASAVMSKWCNIRHTFIKSLKTKSGQAAKKKYIYSDNLQFLLKIVTPDETESSIPNQNDPESRPESQQSLTSNLVQSMPSSSSTFTFTNRRGTKRLNTVDEEILKAIQVKPVESELIDDDRAFMISLLPTVKQLNEDDKFKFRIEVMELLRKFKNRRLSSSSNTIASTDIGDLQAFSPQQDTQQFSPPQFIQLTSPQQETWKFSFQQVTSQCSSQEDANVVVQSFTELLSQDFSTT